MYIGNLLMIAFVVTKGSYFMPATGQGLFSTPFFVCVASTDRSIRDF